MEHLQPVGEEVTLSGSQAQLLQPTHLTEVAKKPRHPSLRQGGPLGLVSPPHCKTQIKIPYREGIVARAWGVHTHLQHVHTRDSLRETIAYNFWNVKHTELLWVGPVYQGQRPGKRQGSTVPSQIPLPDPIVPALHLLVPVVACQQALVETAAGRGLGGVSDQSGVSLCSCSGSRIHGKLPHGPFLQILLFPLGHVRL